VGERVRIAVLAPTDRELLRITFAREHFQQAQDVAIRDRPDACTCSTMVVRTSRM
jgi:hypothetical protein